MSILGICALVNNLLAAWRYLTFDNEHFVYFSALVCILRLNGLVIIALIQEILISPYCFFCIAAHCWVAFRIVFLEIADESCGSFGRVLHASRWAAWRPEERRV